jgi:hypothetical protein
MVYMTLFDFIQLHNIIRFQSDLVKQILRNVCRKKLARSDESSKLTRSRGSWFGRLQTKKSSLLRWCHEEEIDILRTVRVPTSDSSWQTGMSNKNLR